MGYLQQTWRIYLIFRCYLKQLTPYTSIYTLRCPIFSLYLCWHQVMSSSQDIIHSRLMLSVLFPQLHGISFTMHSPLKIAALVLLNPSLRTPCSYHGTIVEKLGFVRDVHIQQKKRRHCQKQKQYQKADLIIVKLVSLLQNFSETLTLMFKVIVRRFQGRTHSYCSLL